MHAKDNTISRKRRRSVDKKSRKKRKISKEPKSKPKPTEVVNVIQPAKTSPPSPPSPPSPSPSPSSSSDNRLKEWFVNAKSIPVEEIETPFHRDVELSEVKKALSEGCKIMQVKKGANMGAYYLSTPNGGFSRFLAPSPAALNPTSSPWGDFLEETDPIREQQYLRSVPLVPPGILVNRRPVNNANHWSVVAGIHQQVQQNAHRLNYMYKHLLRRLGNSNLPVQEGLAEGSAIQDDMHELLMELHSMIKILVDEKEEDDDYEVTQGQEMDESSVETTESVLSDDVDV